MKLTCSPIRLGVHDDKLWTQFAYSSAFEDRNQTSEVLQVQRVAGPPDLGVVLRALHGAVQALVSGGRVAHKVTHVVGIRDGRLGENTGASQGRCYQNSLILRCGSGRKL